MKPKIAVAMSGGVDSSVAAALLKKEGADVTGFFCYFWSEGKGEGEELIQNKCCSLDSEMMARRMCQKLNIPFYTLNLSREFKKKVVDRFVDSYEEGNTPNPCVECNREIKFGLLLDKIRSLGFDFLASGHYSQVEKRGDQYLLKKGLDELKDQSYFLYTLTQDKLKHIKFPIGKMKKSEVRKLASRLDIPSAKREESQGICFVKEKKHNNFLERNLKNIKQGRIVDQDGEVLGKHSGLPYYTLGQRGGIGIGGTGPYYVYKRDLKSNTLHVTSDPEDKKLFSSDMICQRPTWILGEKPPLPKKCLVKVRYMKQPVEVVIEEVTKKHIKASFIEPLRAVMSGQSAVFYDNEVVLGGGIIE
ncbi:tRNA 2-thiouridine(34) synthase MnmA [Patescibacteria group bacterium]|nr:tRNA 2-thiouridine(34) synthase MnmA [Patescibacteria group bacterium]